MPKENLAKSNSAEPCVPITRARNGATTCTEQSKEQVHKVVALPCNAKRAAALDENNNDNAPLIPCNQHKKRAVLKDVTNVSCGNPHKKRAVLKDISNVSCGNPPKKSLNATNLPKNQKHGIKGTVSGCKLAPSYFRPTCMHQRVDNAQFQSSVLTSMPTDDLAFHSRIDKYDGEGSSEETLPKTQQGENFVHDAKSAVSNMPDFIDIDTDHMDPRLCSLYAHDIFLNLRDSEIIGRPTSTYMEKVQQDIKQNMRGILVDWLAEVCSGHKLVAKTLYLTVHLIDAFLSKESVKRKNLQLLGITSLLIASKYEETCAPSVDDLCILTDNTYTKGEVLALETRVLNTLGFRLAVPTAETFLRRFLWAAQASYRNPSPEFEFLANYLAESTLIHYSFLKFLPSAIAASAVFLARWTQHQRDHPWNPTLEYYTNYKASDLKPIVHTLRAVQLNRDECPLHAVRDKYQKDEFRNVSALLSPELPDALFF